MTAPIDAREVFLRARQARAKSKKKRRRPPGQQQVCARDGCYSTDGPFRFGLCDKCYQQLRAKPNKRGPFYGERAPIAPDRRVVLGQMVLVSQAHPEKRYRGAYGIVRRLDDDGAVVLLEFTGESPHVTPPRRIAKLAGRLLLVFVEYVLPVEE